MREAIEKNPNMTEKEARELVDKCLKVLYYRDARSFNKVNWTVIIFDNTNNTNTNNSDSNGGGSSSGASSNGSDKWNVFLATYFYNQGIFAAKWGH